MTLQKITTENNVKTIAQIEQNQEKDIKPNTLENNSLPRKQNKKLSQYNKKFVKFIRTGERFRINKGWRTMSCYFWLKSKQIRWLHIQKQNHKKAWH